MIPLPPFPHLPTCPQGLVHQDVIASGKKDEYSVDGGGDELPEGEPFEGPGDDDSPTPTLPLDPAGEFVVRG